MINGQIDYSLKTDSELVSLLKEDDKCPNHVSSDLKVERSHYQGY